MLSSDNDVLYGEALDITGAAINAYETQSNSYPFYAKFKGTLGVNGNYYQFTMDGANTYVSLSNLSDANKALFTDGETATVYGYYTGYQSKNKFHQFVFVSKESTGEVTPIFKVDKNAVDVAASATTHTIALTANVAWTAAISGEGAKFVKGDGTLVTSLSGENNASVNVSFPANESTEGTKTYTVTFKAEGLEDAVVTITQAKKAAAGDPVTVSLTLKDKYGSTANGTQVGTIEIATGVVMSVNTDGNNGKFYDSGAEWRLYQTNNPTLTVAVGASNQLISVKFTYNQSNGGTLVFNGNNVASGEEVEVSGLSAAFTVASTTGATNAQVKIKAVSVTYK